MKSSTKMRAKMTLKVLDLFSGIGGFSLGLERAGMETVAFCEMDEPCNKVLRKHWKDAIIAQDVRQLKYIDGCLIERDENIPHNFRLTSKKIDLICGGYPCTGHSVAGKKKGFENEGSSLWKEYLRLIGEIKPKYCIIENSPNLRNTGLAEMLQAFHEVGYNAEWSIISAYSIGAPHQRERLYIVLWRADLSYCNPFRFWQTNYKEEKASSWWWAKRLFKRSPLFKQAAKVVSRVLQFDDGISKELLKESEEKIKQLGNSILPQIPELIGRAIMEHENGR